MKKTILVILTITFFLFVFNLTKAQTTEVKLDQKELMNKLIGTWHTESINDTIIGVEVEKFGKGFIGSDIRVVKGVKTYLSKFSIGYSKKDDNFKIFMLFLSGGYLTRIASFISENVLAETNLQNFDPTKVTGKAELTFISPTSILYRVINLEGKTTKEIILTKVNK